MSDSNRFRDGIPTLKWREGEWGLYLLDVSPATNTRGEPFQVLRISSRNENNHPLTTGAWADVYLAYKRYALMLMKE